MNDFLQGFLPFTLPDDFWRDALRFFTGITTLSFVLSIVFVRYYLLPLARRHGKGFIDVYFSFLKDLLRSLLSFLRHDFREILKFSFSLLFFSLVLLTTLYFSNNSLEIIEYMLQGFVYFSLFAAVVPWIEAQLPKNQIYKTVSVVLLWSTGTFSINMYKFYYSSPVKYVGEIGLVLPILFFVATVILLLRIMSSTAIEITEQYLNASQLRAIEQKKTIGRKEVMERQKVAQQKKVGRKQSTNGKKNQRRGKRS